LREKLGDAYIRTIKGVGYTFNEKWAEQDQVF
jgi:DNA-binding response OmpR family regulator